MKNEFIQFRTDSALKEYLQKAADFSRLTLSAFLQQAAVSHAEGLASRGFKVRPPNPVSTRRKVAA